MANDHAMMVLATSPTGNTAVDWLIAVTAVLVSLAMLIGIVGRAGKGAAHLAAELVHDTVKPRFDTVDEQVAAVKAEVATVAARLDEHIDAVRAPEPLRRWNH